MLDDVAMPVVGPSATVCDTFVEQIVANAKAAIDRAVELGVTDPERVVVAGHSHGALMTANLLAWSESTASWTRTRALCPCSRRSSAGRSAASGARSAQAPQ